MSAHALTDARAHVAALLAAAVADQTELAELVTVNGGPVDAAVDPCYVLGWSDPWMVRASFCNYTARVQVIAVGGRIEAEGGLAWVETLTALALDALTAASLTVADVAAPAAFALGGIDYVAARLTVEHPVTIGG